MEITLKNLIDKGYTRKRMANELGVHINTIYRWMLKYNLQTCPKKLCKLCGQNDPKMFDVERHTACRKCRGRRHFRDRKADAITYKGGKCSRCGYNKCQGALDFHHDDPKEKKYQWRKMRIVKIEEMYKELDKCTLLCKNCHSEVHWELDNADLPIGVMYK